MSRIEIEEGSHFGWPAILVFAGRLRLAFVPHVGGRLMSVTDRGEELLFANPELAGHLEDARRVFSVAARKREIGLLPWGGDRTWLAPRDRWPGGLPPYDLDCGPWEADAERDQDGSVTVVSRSPVCRETGLRLERRVRIPPEGGGWVVRHRVENASPQIAEWGLWSVAMLLRPGVVWMPTRPGSPFPGGVKTFEREGRSVEERERVLSAEDDLVRVECRSAAWFKLGADPEPGAIAAWLPGREGGHLLVKRVSERRTGGGYGHGCSVEVFSSPALPYFEIQAHGRVARLEPGGRSELVEEVSLVELAGRPRAPFARLL